MATKAKAKIEPLVLTFEFDKETKGTHRFAEDAGQDDLCVGTLYVRKHAIEALGDPEVLKVTIERGE